MSDNEGMRLVFDYLGEVLGRKPGELTDRLTPWVLLILGGALLMLMFYSCASAHE